MGDKTDLPRNDDPIERHQFYATSASKIDKNAKDIDGIGAKIREFVTSFETVRDTVNNAKTAIRTAMTISSTVWLLGGGVIVGWVQHSLANYEQQGQKLDVLEKRVTAIEFENNKEKDLPDQVTASRRMAVDLQNRMELAEKEIDALKKSPTKK